MRASKEKGRALPHREEGVIGLVPLFPIAWGEFGFIIPMLFIPWSCACCMLGFVGFRFMLLPIGLIVVMLELVDVEEELFMGTPFRLSSPSKGNSIPLDI